MTSTTMPVDTARLVLRVPELADAETLLGIFWDPEVVRQKQVTLRHQPAVAARVRVKPDLWTDRRKQKGAAKPEAAEKVVAR